MGGASYGRGSISTGVRVGVVDQPANGMTEHIEDGIESFDAALRRARGVDDQRAVEGARHRATEPTERTDESHRLGQAGRLTVDHCPRTLRREITGAEAGTAGGDDQPVETVGQVAQRIGDRELTVLGDRALDHQPAGLGQPCFKGSA